MGLWQGVVGRLLGVGKRRLRDRIRRAEARGDLAAATDLALTGGSYDEATRLLELRARSAPEPLERLSLLDQAARYASGDRHRALLAGRHRIALELAQTSALVLTRVELAAIGKELEEIGEPALAARAYADAGDLDGRVRALTALGEVEEVERVLEQAHETRTEERRVDALRARFFDRVASGARRSALELASQPLESSLSHERDALIEKRAMGPIRRLELHGAIHEIAFGERITIGRSGATVALGAPGVSRQHVEIFRVGDEPMVRDLGSRNGTRVAGARIDRPLPIGNGLTLELGSDVSLRVAPSSVPGCAVTIAVASRTIQAPLGALAVGGLSVTEGPDGWLEVHAPSGSLVLGDLAVASPVQLCRGDTIRETRAGDVRLRVP